MLLLLLGCCCVRLFVFEIVVVEFICACLLCDYPFVLRYGVFVLFVCRCFCDVSVLVLRLWFVCVVVFVDPLCVSVVLCCRALCCVSPC